MSGRNVLGGGLKLCSADPVTGFYRDGCCTSGRRDVGGHTVCAMMTREFLDHQRLLGNDLVTPVPELAFPGLNPGESWCVSATRWLQAYEDGVAPPVVLAATNVRALEVVSLEALLDCAVDVPEDLTSLLGPDRGDDWTPPHPGLT